MVIVIELVRRKERYKSEYKRSHYFFFKKSTHPPILILVVVPILLITQVFPVTLPHPTTTIL